MTRKMIKKMLALLLVVLMLCSLCACGEKSESKDADNTSTTSDKRENDSETTIEPEVDIVAEAETLIAQGKYEDAYMLLKDVNEFSGNKAALDLLDKLVWVPVEWEWKCTDSLYSDSGEKVITSHWICYYTYDENGLLLKKDAEPMPSSYLKDDQTGETYDQTYTYDANGNCLTVTGQDLSVTYTYDENGNMLTQRETSTSGYADAYTYTYDADGNRLTERFESSYRIDESTYSYDADGNMLTSHEVWNYLESGRTITFETTFTYDEKGRPLSRREIRTASDEEGEKTSGERFTYDEQGRFSTWYDYDSSDSMEATNTFDENGRLVTLSIEEYESGDGMDVSFTYDADGNLSQVVVLSQADGGDVQQLTNFFTYDESQNRLTQTNDQADGSTVYFFDDNGYCIREQGVQSDGTVNYDYSFNQYGKTLSYTDNRDYYATEQRITWKLFYYPDGAPTSVQEIDKLPNDHIISYRPTDLYVVRQMLLGIVWVSNTPPFG